MEPLPNTRKPGTTPIDVDIDSTNTPPTSASINTNLTNQDQPMNDHDETDVPPPPTPGTASPEAHKLPPSPDGNKPSTFIPTALRLLPKVRYYHGPKPVPTQEEALTWSSTKYTSFVTNNIGGMSDWVLDYLLAYNLSTKPSAFSNKLDPGLAVGTEDALRYLANTHHAIAETKRLCSEDQLHDNRMEVNPDPNTPYSISEEIGHQSTHRTFTYTSTPLYRLIHKYSSCTRSMSSSSG